MFEHHRSELVDGIMHLGQVLFPVGKFNGKPCPVCGRMDPRLQKNFDDRGTWFIYCYGERIGGTTSCGLNSELYATKEQAIEEWNKVPR